MKIEYSNSPVPHLIIRDCFAKAINKKILKEAVKLERKFESAVVGSDSKVDESIRNNKVCYYHQVYPIVPVTQDKPNIDPMTIRKTSPLIKAFMNLFGDNDFRQLLSSCPSPLSEFVMTNTDEIQVSRYGGDSAQKYDWHIDRFNNRQRQITMVYYFNTKPKKYSGGELMLSKNPIYKHKILGTDNEMKTITPENNMLVIFPSNVAHCVKETTSPKKFEDGRLSANIWVGVR